jgi:DNA-directed RNA polymerase subunit beta'
MKDMGYKFAFKGGLSFSLGDIRIPDQKKINSQMLESKLKVFLQIITWVLLLITNVTTSY